MAVARYPFDRLVLCLGLAAALAACDSSSSKSTSSTPSTPAGPPVMSLLAGSMTGSGNTGGTGTAARFLGPYGVAVDSAGNAYVADTSNHVIRKITPAGVVTFFAGTCTPKCASGSADGTGAAASFNFPQGVAVDGSGNVYVADSNNRTIRKITPAGVVTTLAGTAGTSGSADGTGAAASFSNPTAIAVDNTGTLFVLSGSALRQITAAGVVTTLAGNETNPLIGDGTGAGAHFNAPQGIAVDSSGTIYVADYGSSIIRQVTSGGVVTTIAGTALAAGSVDGTGAAARFDHPRGIAVDSLGTTVYISDSGNNTIRAMTIPGAVVTTLAGSAGPAGTADGTGAAARFSFPHGLGVDSSGTVYVADTSNSTIRKVTPAGVVTTLAGSARVIGSADGTGAAATFSSPNGVAADSSGAVYVTDINNSTIRKITAAGVVSTLAGTALATGSADGTGAAASFNFPTDVAVDGSGTVFVVDQSNQTIRKITAAGVVTTLAGTAGVTGSLDGTGPAAQFYYPQGIAVDGTGNLYVSDLFNKTIRKITALGVVTTLAGTAGVTGSADATGPAASFAYPAGIAVASSGNVYVADNTNRTIRKITPAGVVTTLAGTAGVRGTTDGTGPAALFSTPFAIAVDSAENVYVGDGTTLRKITPAGVVTTVVGVAGQLGFTPGALPGVIGGVNGLAIRGTTAYFSAYDGVVQVTNLP